eukprot:scaffold12584_cov69-Phaeocystis_antarctica.AAC.1
MAAAAGRRLGSCARSARRNATLLNRRALWLAETSVLSGLSLTLSQLCLAQHGDQRPATAIERGFAPCAMLGGRACPGKVHERTVPECRLGLSRARTLQMHSARTHTNVPPRANGDHVSCPREFVRFTSPLFHFVSNLSDTAIVTTSAVMMLRIFLAVASVLSCSALVMPMHTPRTVASFSSARTSPVNMGFEDSLAGMIDGVSAFFAKGGDKKAP